METEELAKQIDFLEKIDKKIIDNQSSLKQNLIDIKRQIEMKYVRLEEESFKRDQLNHKVIKIRENILSLQKKLNVN